MKTLAATPTFIRIALMCWTVGLAHLLPLVAAMCLIASAAILGASVVRGTQYLMAESRRNELRVRRARRMARFAR